MSLHLPADPDFDVRWTAWVERGAAHERLVRRRLTILLPAAILLVLVVFLLRYAQ